MTEQVLLSFVRADMEDSQKQVLGIRHAVNQMVD
jgi:hypothetical protein